MRPTSGFPSTGDPDTPAVRPRTARRRGDCDSGRRTPPFPAGPPSRRRGRKTSPTTRADRPARVATAVGWRGLGQPQQQRKQVDGGFRPGAQQHAPAGQRPVRLLPPQPELGRAGRGQTTQRPQRVGDFHQLHGRCPLPGLDPQIGQRQIHQRIGGIGPAAARNQRLASTGALAASATPR